MCQFEIYTGKDDEDDEQNQQDPACPVKGLSARVVYNLTCHL